MTYSLLGLSGSLRQNSANSKLLREAARLSGATFTEADLRLALYDGDAETETGVPEPVVRLAEQIAAADAVAISTPEYNSGISGVLKNTLDWVSRTEGNPWEGKPVILVSAAAGRAGGVRALTMLRSCMMPFRARMVAGPEVAVADCNNQFDENGQITPRYEASLTKLMQALETEVQR